MLVKICGIQTLEAARTAVENGADFIGFIFADTRRSITPKKAAEIIKNLPEHVKTVGVFVNESILMMELIASAAGIDYIQLHGNETAATASALSRPVIKAFPAEFERISEMKDYPCDYLLLDHPSGGGTGRTFDWKTFERLGRDFPPVLLAGGLTPENVQMAIQILHPAGVDVSSGVETNGQKDDLKIKQFLIHAKKMKG